MKKTILIVVILAMFSWALYDFVFSSNQTVQEDEETSVAKNTITSEVKDNPDEEKAANTDKEGLNIGNMAPDFKLQTLDGETVQLSDFRGKRVMINFWATWCPPCRAEMPDMQKFHEKKDIVILAINLTETESNLLDVKRFVKDFELTFPILKDEKTTVANQYQIQPIPTSYMVDSKGRIQYKAFGAMNYDLMVQEFEKMQ
ncbi:MULTISPECIES: TlpA disulfide reductase family protein [Virgibacillus]|uniref:TlpA disulfide reductase family protein n=1 Tax=Virgibacillus TaxID=84406 RepID=UPI000EF48485|nr:MULTISPECIES: TlpA disulfide reductase family protein [Virgibacillus]WBX81668.1 TlpA disulfide reductase family protein [Virgibacillus salarius]